MKNFFFEGRWLWLLVQVDPDLCALGVSFTISGKALAVLFGPVKVIVCPPVARVSA